MLMFEYRIYSWTRQTICQVHMNWKWRTPPNSKMNWIMNLAKPLSSSTRLKPANRLLTSTEVGNDFRSLTMNSNTVKSTNQLLTSLYIFFDNFCICDFSSDLDLLSQAFVGGSWSPWDEEDTDVELLKLREVDLFVEFSWLLKQLQATHRAVQDRLNQVRPFRLSRIRSHLISHQPGIRAGGYIMISFETGGRVLAIFWSVPSSLWHHHHPSHRHLRPTPSPPPSLIWSIVNPLPYRHRHQEESRATIAGQGAGIGSKSGRLFWSST